MKKLILALFAIAAFASIIFLAESPRAPDTARAASKSESSKAPAINRDLIIPIGEISPSKEWIAPAIGMMILNVHRRRFEPITELAGYRRAPRPIPRNKDPFC